MSPIPPPVNDGGGGASETYVNQKVADLVDGAPAMLDTLNELAAAINNDPDIAAHLTALISNAQSTANSAQSDATTATSDASAAQADIDAHEAATIGAHHASAIDVLDTEGHFTGDDVEGVLQQIGQELAAAGGGGSGHLGEQFIKYGDVSPAAAFAAPLSTNGDYSVLDDGVTPLQVVIANPDATKILRVGMSYWGPAIQAQISDVNAEGAFYLDRQSGIEIVENGLQSQDVGQVNFLDAAQAQNQGDNVFIGATIAHLFWDIDPLSSITVLAVDKVTATFDSYTGSVSLSPVTPAAIIDVHGVYVDA